MLARSLEIGASLVNLSLRDGAHGESVERLLQVLHIIGQISIGRYDDVVHQIGKHLTQSSFLFLGKLCLGDSLIGTTQCSHRLVAGINSLITIATVFVSLL